MTKTTIRLIDQQPHFWELYQDQDQYYLSIAVDMSSVVSCWDIYLTDEDVAQFKQHGRVAIEKLSNLIVAEVYRGDFSSLESRTVSELIKHQLHIAFKAWHMHTH